MVRATALAGSLVIHGGVAIVALAALAALAALRQGWWEPPQATTPPREISIDLVGRPPDLAPDPPGPPGPPGGGTSPIAAPALRAPRPALRQARVASTHGGPQLGAVETTLRMEATPRSESSESSESIASLAAADAAGATGETGDGPERGPGGGRRGGLGLAIGRSRAEPPIAQLPVIEPVREPAPSRASPPRLIYPSRQRDAAESQQFVARLTIDTDGYVVGVRLTHGLNRSADERAAAAVWRFRYSPATDDAGQPVQVVIEQSFLVE